MWNATDKVLVAQNWKYDHKVMRRVGVEVQCPVFDTMLAHYVLQPDLKHGMDYLAETELGYKTIPITDLLGKKGKNQKTMADIPPEDVVNYACEDADITLRLADPSHPACRRARRSATSSRPSRCRWCRCWPTWKWRASGWMWRPCTPWRTGCRRTCAS